MDTKLIVVFLVLFLLPVSFADQVVNRADHKDAPFCGDGVLESGETCDIDNIDSDPNYFGCQGRYTYDTSYNPGDICTSYSRFRPDQKGLCLRGEYNPTGAKNGVCWVGGEKYFGKESRIVVISKSVGLREPVLIYIYSPGGPGDAFVKEVQEGPDHYFGTFCYGVWWRCGTNDPIFGYASPGPLAGVTNFSNWFEEELSEEDKPHWFKTDTETDTGPTGSYIFGFNVPGEYRIEIIDMRGNRIESESFYVCKDPKLCEPIDGVIEDGTGLPVPDLQVKLVLDDGISKTTYTDKEGKYDFGIIKNDDPFEDASTVMRLIFTFKDKDGNFQIHDQDAILNFQNDDRDNKLPVEAATKSYPISEHRQKIDFKNDLDLFDEFHVNAYDKKELQNIARTQIYLSKAVRFAKKEFDLNLKDKNNEPLKVILNSNLSTLYRRNKHEIHISPTDSKWNDPSSPDNAEWHEFSHALTKISPIGGEYNYPSVPEDENRFNHLGFANPSTTDSWTEGFAIWLPSAMSNEMEYVNPGDKTWIYIVADTYRINLEDNIKSWDNLGRDEDVAVGAILWDLYDSSDIYGTADDENVKIDFIKLWTALNKKTNNDFKDVYDAVISMNPAQKEDIDKIFVNHGFFVDSNGDHIWQTGEEVGRAASPKIGFKTSFDLNGDGNFTFWDLDFKVGDLLRVGKENNVSALWGRIRTDDHGLIDLDGDGKSELNESSFYVFPYSERRQKPYFKENVIQIDITDEDGNIIEASQMTFKMEYPDSSKNYEYTVNVSNNRIPVWIFEDATLTITSKVGEFESEEIQITGEEYTKNIEKGTQNNYTLELPATSKELKKFVDNPKEENKNSNWMYLVLIVIFAGLIYVYWKSKEAKK